jgi:hypothetical protein
VPPDVWNSYAFPHSLRKNFWGYAPRICTAKTAHHWNVQIGRSPEDIEMKKNIFCLSHGAHATPGNNENGRAGY